MRRWLALLLALPLYAQFPPQFTPAERQLALDSFEKVWTTIRDTHWEKNPGGLDWQAIHREYRPKIEQAQSLEQARAVMRDMLGRLHETHFAILPGSLYEDGALPEGVAGAGSPGIDLRVLNGHAVVTELDPESPAERAGVKPGWVISSVNGKDLAAQIRKVAADPAISEITLTHSLLARLSGPIGGKISAAFLDGQNRTAALDLGLAPPRGQPSQFGNLPTTDVWFESKHLSNTGYVRFNMFLDIPVVMGGFGKAIEGCKDCDGLIIDLRGNPGGIGAMAMGMAGYLVSKPGLRLGTMYTRDVPLKFVINPRSPAFTGPVAVLVDACSASTSEILAGGLKDLGRARIFGTRSAAAALPSIIERLPDGDGFQYAVANYISEGGKPLEGAGVVPDVAVKLTREALLAGRDPVIEAAQNWIQKQRNK
ncbi:MAG TPA: S41 family peptidase [Bryobacteraceae bacterium]|nr:S41 family peptidase [Bryobacteraceae bacterium]